MGVVHVALIDRQDLERDPVAAHATDEHRAFLTNDGADTSLANGLRSPIDLEVAAATYTLDEVVRDDVEVSKVNTTAHRRRLQPKRRAVERVRIGQVEARNVERTFEIAIVVHVRMNGARELGGLSRLSVPTLPVKIVDEPSGTHDATVSAVRDAVVVER